MMGDSSELSLWNVDKQPVTVAEAALLHFASAYQAGLREANSNRPLDRWMDEHSYACLLLCEEHAQVLTEASVVALEACRDDAFSRPLLGTYDMLPWNVALHVLGKAPYALDTLVANLTHGASDLRAFMFEIGWFVRRRLPVEEATDRLLRNVADTLGHWDMSLGLCSYLFEAEEEFWAFADAYRPDPRFEEQYRERLQAVREAGIDLCRDHFAVLESSIRALIEAFALGLTCAHEPMEGAW